MKNIKNIAVVMLAVAGFVVTTGCELSAFSPDDCHINSDYQIECGDFDPGLQQN